MASRRLRILGLVGAVAIAGCATHHASGAPEPPALCAGTTPGSQVVVYSTTGLEYWYADVFSDFQARCHVAISYFGASSDDVLNRLKGERTSPIADVTVMFPPDITVAADEGLVTGAGAATASVPADRCDPQRRWCAVALDYTSWVDNPYTIGTAPTTWSDLLDPRFAGAVISSGPSVPIGLANVALLASAMGTDPAFAYLAKLETSTTGHYTVTDTMSRVVAVGDALVANGDLQEDENDIDQYRAVSIWFPANQSVELPYGAALVTGGHHPGNGRALLADLCSTAAQLLAGDVFATPAVANVVPTDARSVRVQQALRGVTIVRPDWEQVATEAAAWRARWEKLRTAPDGLVIPGPTTTLPPVP